MRPTQPNPTPGPPGRMDRWIIPLSGILALAPLVAYHRLFARLFWYGDEFDLIDQFDRIGFGRWLGTVFAENYVPLFKLLWGGAIFVFGGSYAAMIVLVWLTHGLNVALLGRVMRACGLPWVAVAVALMAFGLTAANFETLAWSVQWSAVLSSTFMLLAIDAFLRAPFGLASYGWATASALSFSRGVLTGGMLACAGLWPATGAAGRPSGRKLRALAYLVPSVGVALLIATMATGNHRHMSGHFGEAAAYGTWNYCLNPAHRLLSVDSNGWRTVVFLGLCKLALAAWAIARGRGRQRILFVLLVAFDVGNAALLGVGRYHTGLPTAVASRYQYASLIGIAPLAGFWVARLWDRIPAPAVLRSAAAMALLFAVAVLMIRQWPDELEGFTFSRGTQSRETLLEDPHPDPHSVPGMPYLDVSRAKALIKKYDLH
jgi:hypothetical protein